MDKYWKTGDMIYFGVPIGDARELTEEEFLNYHTKTLETQVRAKRDSLLKEVVDSVNPMRWEAMTELQKDAWRAYRQALLDIPQQEEFPATITWPTKP